MKWIIQKKCIERIANTPYLVYIGDKKTVKLNKIRTFNLINFLFVSIFFLACSDKDITNQIVDNENNVNYNDATKNSQGQQFAENTKLNLCDLSPDQMLDYLTTKHFTLNGNGGVSFLKKGDIKIKHRGKGYKGKYEIMTNNSIRIYNLLIISGNYNSSNNDPYPDLEQRVNEYYREDYKNSTSNNPPLQGVFNMDCDGMLSGCLRSAGGRNNNTLRIMPNGSSQ